jgi:hypothetical protein
VAESAALFRGAVIRYAVIPAAARPIPAPCTTLPRDARFRPRGRRSARQSGSSVTSTQSLSENPYTNLSPTDENFWQPHIVARIFGTSCQSTVRLPREMSYTRRALNFPAASFASHKIAFHAAIPKNGDNITMSFSTSPPRLIDTINDCIKSRPDRAGDR